MHTQTTSDHGEAMAIGQATEATYGQATAGHRSHGLAKRGSYARTAKGCRPQRGRGDHWRAVLGHGLYVADCAYLWCDHRRPDNLGRGQESLGMAKTRLRQSSRSRSMDYLVPRSAAVNIGSPGRRLRFGTKEKTRGKISRKRAKEETARGERKIRASGVRAFIRMMEGFFPCNKRL